MSLESPCINVCTLDNASGYCMGCLRTLDEIACWTTFTEEERRAVWDALPARRSLVEVPGDPPASRKWLAKRCERCGEGFGCGAQDPAHPCWCASYPAVAPSGSDCLCPACLAAAAT